MDSKKIFITISIVLFLAILGYVLLSKQPTAPAETAAEAEAAEEAAKKAAEEAEEAAKKAAEEAEEAAEWERVLAAEAVVVAAEEAAAKKAATILAKKAAEEAAKKAAEAAKKAAMIRAKEEAKKAADEAAKKFALLRSYTPNGRYGEPVQVKWGYRTGSKRNNWQCDTICRGVGANFYSTSENGHCGCTTNTQVRDIRSLMFKSNFPGSHPTADWDVKTDYVDYIRVNEE
tara:strand:+ start:8336 stop:9028 length:693 start_codon:yes stop_codon:yes gene_type:complete